MCGRFTQHYTWPQIYEFLNVLGAPQNLQARYNIAPTTLIDMVRHDAEGRRELVRGVRWGSIPDWWKKPLRDMPATFYARVETVHEKPMFRGAYRSQRCVVPASVRNGPANGRSIGGSTRPTSATTTRWFWSRSDLL